MITLASGDILAGCGLTWGEIWRSQDNGATWQEMVNLWDLTSTHCDWVHAFHQLPSGIVLCGVRQGMSIFGSSDNGASWWLVTELSAGATSIYSFAPLPSGEALAGADDGWIWKSSARGMTWAHLANSGETIVSAMCRANL